MPGEPGDSRRSFRVARRQPVLEQALVLGGSAESKLVSERVVEVVEASEYSGQEA